MADAPAADANHVKRTGWFLDVYTHQHDGIVIWFLGEDGVRYRLRQHFPVTFYADGPPLRLRLLWRRLQNSPLKVELGRVRRRELFRREPLSLLSIQVNQPSEQPRLFHRVARDFPDLTYYDSDIQLSLRHAAVYNTFPLARCRVVTNSENWIQEIETLDSPWELDAPAPPLRILRMRPDSDPARLQPRRLLVNFERYAYRLAMKPERPLLVNLRAILARHDPDLILTSWGDTWLLPHLLDCSRRHGFPLPFNRDPGCEVAHRPERTYFSYGQVIYRGQQVHLFGRWHLDGRNVMLWDDYELEGSLEVARVSSLPLQTAARVSPGTAISSMQILTALRMGVLVPWHKQQAERPKTALDMFAADQGGLVYQPITGLHHDVAGIDFISMYPGIMVHFNISPETAGVRKPNPGELERIDTPGRGDEPGLVPRTLAPLLGKRLAFKNRLASTPRWNPRCKSYEARSSAQKWLLVTCFGYLGYKNARFGRIEAHEAVTAYSREALLRAKEAAEELGFCVLHMYVDGMWVKKPGARTVKDLQPLLEMISERTGLPIALDGIYRWVAFLPSRLDARVPVANRYFGVFRDGSIKVRGIEARRRDSPPFVVNTQLQILRLLAAAENAGDDTSLECVFGVLRRKLGLLRSGGVPVGELIINQKLSRELEEYRVPSPPARAAAQLQALGKTLRAGQKVRFLYTRGEPGVYAWDLPQPPDPSTLDLAYYREMLLRAALSVLEPFGVDRTMLDERLNGYTQTIASGLFTSGGAGIYALGPFATCNGDGSYLNWIRSGEETRAGANYFNAQLAGD